MRDNDCSECGVPVVAVTVSACDAVLLSEISARVPADAVDVVVGATTRRLTGGGSAEPR